MNLDEAKKDVISKAEFNDAMSDFSTAEIMRVFIQVLDKYNLVDVKIKQRLMNDAREMDIGNSSNSIYFINDTSINIRLSGKSGTILRLRFNPIFKKQYNGGNTLEIELNNEFFYKRIGKPIKDAGLEIGVYLDEFRFTFQRKEFQKLFNTLIDKMKNIDYYVDLAEISKYRVRITYNYFEDGKDVYYTRVERKKNSHGEGVLYHTRTYGKGNHYHKQQIIKDFNKLKINERYISEINSLEEL